MNGTLRSFFAGALPKLGLKTAVSFILALVLIPSLCAEIADAADERGLRIGVLPFRYYENVTASQAQIISEIVKAHLSELQIIQLIELGSDELMEETTLQLSGAVQTQDVLELGRRYGLRYVLSGSCDTQNGNIQLTVQLTAIPGGRVMYGKTAELGTNTIESDISDFIRALAGDLEGKIIGRSLEDIKTLIALHHWDEAYAVLREYTDIYGESSATDQLKRVIFRIFYRDSKERMYQLSEVSPPPEWNEMVLLMLSYYPGEQSGRAKQGLLTTLEELDGLHRQQRESEIAEIVKDIRSYAGAGNIAYARELMRENRKKYPYSLELAAVEAFLNSREAELWARKAENLLAADEQRQAAYYANKALSLFPASTDYLELVQKIELKGQRERELERTVYSGRNDWAVSKRALTAVKIHSSLTFYHDRLNEVYIDGGFPSVGIELQKYTPVLIPLYRYLELEARLGWGANEMNLSGGDLYADFYHLELLGGIGGILRFHSFSFAVGLHSGIGLLRRDLDMDEINSSASGMYYNPTGSVELQGSAAYSFGTAYDIGLGIRISPMYVMNEGIVNRWQAALWLGRSF